MSDLYGTNNQFSTSLHRLTTKYDNTSDGMMDFLQRQARGENPDPDEFMKLLQKRSNTANAMQAQFSVFNKPLKTVLNESK